MSSENGWPVGRFPDFQTPQQAFQPSQPLVNDLFDFQQQPQPPSIQNTHHDMYAQQQQQQQQAQQSLSMYSQQQQQQQQLQHSQEPGAIPRYPSNSSSLASGSTSSQRLNIDGRGNESTLSSAFGYSSPSFQQRSGPGYQAALGSEASSLTHSGSLYSAEAMMMGMGVSLPRSMEDSSSPIHAPPFEQSIGSTLENQNNYGYSRSTSNSSSMMNSDSQYDIYGTATSVASDPSFASGSSASNRQILSQEQMTAQFQQQNQHSMPFNMQPRQGVTSNVSIQRSKKPAALDLHEAQNRHYSGSNLIGLDSSTPNAIARYNENHGSQAHPAPSPTWQHDQLVQQQQQQQQQLHHHHQHQQQQQQQQSAGGFQQQNYSSGLLSPAHINDSAMSEFQNNLLSSAAYNTDANTAPFVSQSHSFDLMRPTSSASGISLASSRDSGPSNHMQRSDSLGDSQVETPERGLFHQIHQAGGGVGNNSHSPWLASPADSDNSGQFQSQQSHQIRQGPHQRIISTPQRIQQMRDSMMLSKQLTGLVQVEQGGGGGGSEAGLSSYSLPSVNLVDFDYTDHRLSAAMANNAHISSEGGGSSDAGASSRNQRGNTTPTIMEEDDLGTKQILQRQTSSQSLAQNASPSLAQQQQQLQQQGMIHFRHNAPETIVRRRPNIRPNIYQQYLPFTSSNNFSDEPMRDLQDCTPFIDEVLGNYLASPSRLGLGERSVLIMTSKVAQKSYGAEKRFLCPPPMVLLVGSSWWSSCHDTSRGLGESELTVLTPPRLSISMSGEGNMQDSTLEWASNSGRLIDVGNPSSEMAISGRSIGRQLFINDSDEKRRHCEALVHISVPIHSPSDRKPLGTFASKPIKVISKPSKKRQSTRTSDLSVNHGSTISLFHRLRSQTVSTRYLCVSGAPTWFKGSDGEPFLNSDFNTHIPNQGEPSSCFVAKMSSWDPFIIYLVDPHIQAPNPSTGGNSGKPPPAPGYPPPPINVLPLPANGQGQPICYNQPVVLQCLNTAVVSPMMVIRKVDRATTVVGGGQSSSYSSTASRTDPTLETLGDPVSQLHKIAFEVLEDPNAPAPIAENRDVTSPGQSGHFLGCLNEDVGLRKPIGARQWVASTISGPSTPTTPITPMHAPSNLSLSTSSKLTSPSDTLDANKPPLGDSLNAASVAAAAQAAAQTRFSLSQRRSGSGNMSPSAGSMMAGPSSSTSSLQYKSAAAASSVLGGGGGGSSSQLMTDIPTPDSGGEEDGGKVKRPRRVSSSVVVMQPKDRSGSAAAKNRRRGQSLSILGMQNQMNAQYPQNQQQLHHHQQQQQQQQQQYHNHQQQQAAMQSSFSLVSSSDPRSQLHRTSSFANSLTNSETSSLGIPAGAMWTVEVHDSDIWTIVGIDIARHTFYLPTELVGGTRAKTDVTDQGIAHLINVPAPAAPITPLPILHSFSSPNNSISKNNGGGPSSLTPRSGSKSSNQQGSGSNSSTGNHEYVTLIGENLTKELFIYFGDWRSTRVIVESSSTVYCEPPPAYEESGAPRGRVPIILVRRDGVVFPTTLIYTC